MKFRPRKTISGAIGNEIQTPENHFRSDRKWNSDPGKPFPKRSEMEFRPGKAISEVIGNEIQTRGSHFGVTGK